MRRARTFAIGFAFAVTAATAYGQGTQGERPVQGVFGGASDIKLTQIFDSTRALGGSYEDNGGVPIGDANVSPFERTGYYTSFSGALGYGHRARRVQFGANLGTQARYYREDGDLLTMNRYGGVGLIATFARRTQVAVNQTVSYSPAYFTGIFPTLSDSEPGAVTALGADYAVSDLKALTYDTSASVSYGLTRGGTMSFTSTVQHTDFSQSSSYKDLNTYGIGGRYLQRISRWAQLRFGYTYRHGQYGFVESESDATLHDLDIGVDYNRPLSSSRRTHIDFGTGSAIVNTPFEGGNTTSGQLDERKQYRLVGRLGLTHDMGRTWRARVAYNRSFGLVQGFPEPVFSDGVSVSTTGFVNRRVEIMAFGAYSTGEIGQVTLGGRGLDAYSGTARIQYGINRLLAVSSEAFYYRYEIGPGVNLPTGVLPFRDRSGVRGGLTLWLPFVRN
jgi:hypothetical protein